MPHWLNSDQNELSETKRRGRKKKMRTNINWGLKLFALQFRDAVVACFKFRKLNNPNFHPLKISHFLWGLTNEFNLPASITRVILFSITRYASNCKINAINSSLHIILTARKRKHATSSLSHTSSNLKSPLSEPSSYAWKCMRMVFMVKRVCCKSSLDVLCRLKIFAALSSSFKIITF